MKLPNWLKIVWWVLLTGVLTAYLYKRYPQLAVGQAVPADIIVFVIWVALLLAPLFSEVSLLGITLKQEVEGLKTFVSSQISDVKAEVRSAVDVRATFSPQFNIPAPAADSQLPDIERCIKVAVSDALASHGLRAPPAPAQVAVPQDVSLLFATRYNLDKELRRIGEARQLNSESRRPATAIDLARALVQAELLEPRLSHAIREVYSVCSPAIHGEPVTEAQMAFVRDVGSELIGALRTIS